MSQPARAMSHPVPQQRVDYATKYENLVRKLKGLPPYAPVSITHQPVPMRPRATSRARDEATHAETDSLIVELRKQKKAQLYDRAKQIQLAGRSNMTKEQLVLALAAHERKRQQQTAGRPATPAQTTPPARNPTPPVRTSGNSWLGRPLDPR